MGGAEEHKKKVGAFVVSGMLLVAIAAVIAVGLNGDTYEDEIRNDQVASTVKAVNNFCNPTDYKKECEKNIVQDAEATLTTNPRELVKIAFNVTIAKLEERIKEAHTLEEFEKDPRAKLSLVTCHELMQLSVDEFKKSLHTINHFDQKRADELLGSLKVWLSGAITYQDTCLDGFVNTNDEDFHKMKSLLTKTMHMSSNALAIITKMADSIQNKNVTQMFFGRRVLNWIDREHGAGVRRLLNHDASPTIVLEPNVVVALDGSGDFKTIKEALNKVPMKNKKPFVIFIKEGVYHEQVEVSKNMTHVVFIGEGGKKTRITGNKSFADGFNTYKTATVAVLGDNFVAINMGFENSAGPTKYQAVALRVQSDKSIFYNCSMDGYQDTLYAHTMRQFYRDCTISGTIDFVFGDGVAVFQNCTFKVRKPLNHQHCVVTAQGRKERHEATGLVILGGSIVSEPEYHPVRFENKAYLARPWKSFSRTVFMDTFIDDLIDPKGFLPWKGPDGHDTGMDTCFYAEYHNAGPGSDKSKRVKWGGVFNLNSKSAKWFAPSKFFHGDDWIEASGIPYSPDVLEHHKHKKAASY